MEKGTLLDRMGVGGDDRILLAKTLDRWKQARQRNIPAATDFLSPRQQALAADFLRQSGVKAEEFFFTGGVEGAERRIALFPPDWMNPEDAHAPIRFLHAAFRKEDALTHRDLLGGLMGMGVVREKIGDIYVGEESADLCVQEAIADFLLQSWENAGRAKLRVTETDTIQVPAAKIEEYRDTVSSLRLDSVMSSGFRIGRGKAAEVIAAGRVQVNWRDCIKADKMLAQGDTVTARGYGKIELAAVGGLTRKGRTAIVIRRYL